MTIMIVGGQGICDQASALRLFQQPLGLVHVSTR
jgi:hypothetical protein